MGVLIYIIIKCDYDLKGYVHADSVHVVLQYTI